MIYVWTKTFHLLFVIAWMAAVFYLPRLLVNLAEAGDVAPVRDRLLLMGRRLYSFGHSMFGIAVLLGLLLMLGYRIWPESLPDVVGGRAWIHAKLGLVALLLVYFIVCGRQIDRFGKGAPQRTPVQYKAVALKRPDEDFITLRSVFRRLFHDKVD